MAVPASASAPAPAPASAPAPALLLLAAAASSPLADGTVTCIACEGVASCVRDGGGVPKMTATGEFLYKCGDGSCVYSRAERTRKSDSLKVHDDTAVAGDDAAPAPAPAQAQAPAAKKARTRR